MPYHEGLSYHAVRNVLKGREKMRAINLLTDLQVKKADIREKAYKLSDGGGLYLAVMPSGEKAWRYNFTSKVTGKQKTLHYGTWPALSLKDARQKHLEAKQVIAEGRDPAQEKHDAVMKAAQEARRAGLTFEAVALDWFKTQQSGNTEKTQESTLGRMKKHILPVLGNKPLDAVSFDDCLRIVRAIEAGGKYEMARRVANILCQIGRHAKLCRLIEHSFAEDLTRLLAKRPAGEKQGLPAITDSEGVARMLKNLSSYAGNASNDLSAYMRAALRLIPLLGQRSQELIAATWDEIDFEAALWRIPSERMKARKAHEIPLSTQAVAILRELSKYRTTSRYLFPSGGKLGHIRGESVNAAMHRAGIPKGEMCLHGWRKVLSTLAHEAGAPHALVEKCLAHSAGDAVAMAYDKSKLLEARRVLLQWWADYLDALRDDTVLPRLALDKAGLYA